MTHTKTLSRLFAFGLMFVATPALMGADGGCTNNGDVPIGSDYEPCKDKTCGDACQLCAPNDPDCFETQEVKVCNDSGQCTGGATSCSGGGADPCKDKQCGDDCNPCKPGDTACEALDVVSSCNDQGKCISGNVLCDGYDPCEGKGCGASCTVCPPGDSTCNETTVEKFCNDAGQCGAGNPTCNGGECDAMDAKWDGTECLVALGYTWNGSSCELINCGCNGSQCDALFDSQSACEAKYTECGTASNCDPQDARSDGTDCAAIFGYAWNGTKCEEIDCGCAGTECDQTFNSEAACKAVYGQCEPRQVVEEACIKNVGDSCSTDDDCMSGGCGGETCFNPAISGGASTCECGPPTAPQVQGCGCVQGQCSWYK